MMLHVVAFDELEITVAHGKVMSGVVGDVVNEVANDKGGKHRSDPLRGSENHIEDQVEQAIENGGEGDGDRGRHDQASLLLRLCVMHTVEEEGDAFSTGSFHFHMKEKAMQRVFGESPQKKPEKETKRDVGSERSSRNLHNGTYEEKERHREPDDDHCDGTYVGEKLEKIRLE